MRLFCWILFCFILISNFRLGRYIIPSAKFFMWRVILNGIPTKVNLRLRGVNLNNDNCAMCGEHEESLSHLFITYRVATKVWNMCNRWRGCGLL